MEERSCWRAEAPVFSMDFIFYLANPIMRDIILRLENFCRFLETKLEDSHNNFQKAYAKIIEREIGLCNPQTGNLRDRKENYRIKKRFQ